MDVATPTEIRMEDAYPDVVPCRLSFAAIRGVPLESVMEESERESSENSGMEIDEGDANKEEKYASERLGGQDFALEAANDVEILVLGGIVGPEFLDETTCVGNNLDELQIEKAPEDHDGGWTRRESRVAMPDERATEADRVMALEKALTGFAQRKTAAVVESAIGLIFDSITESYDNYNIHSWEIGFGIRYGKSQSNVKGARCMQELVCTCAGKPTRANSTSCRTMCAAMVRLLRTDDDGWYICETRCTHDHKLLSTCASKLHFSSHKHIDKYTRELVAQLRANNVNLSKVYSVIATFFGRIENIPFTKRCVRTLQEN